MLKKKTMTKQIAGNRPPSKPDYLRGVVDLSNGSSDLPSRYLPSNLRSILHDKEGVSGVRAPVHRYR